MDYKKIGLKTGLEFHQRLDTHKLFCNCSSDITEGKPIMTITRHLRPVAGELGGMDEAALQEFRKMKAYVYEIREGTSCLVEMDESPPNGANPEALETSLIIAMMLHMHPLEEVHFMRKTVIDGSNTSGFQRTAMVAQDGFLKTAYGKIPMDNLFLEEESAGIVDESAERKVYRLDRLGIPLVEIATGIMRLEPKEVKDVALSLGRLLRVTGRVQRGLGTIRQDVNISISKGARVEIKGLQEINLLDTAIELEVQRQLALLGIKDELKKRKVKPQKYVPKDVTEHFKGTENKFIRNDLEKGGKVYALIAPGFDGILGKELTPGKRFGTELAGHAKTYGLGGIIHSDEDLKKYRLDSAFAKISKGPVIIASGDERKIIGALEDIARRIDYAFVGVPEETRKFLPDGNSTLMRTLAGSKRMYPETDVPVVSVSKKMLADIRKRLPDDPEKVLQKLKKLGLSDELAEIMVTSKHATIFYKLADMKINPTLAASTLENTLTSLRREGVPVGGISDEMITEVFRGLGKKFSKEALPNVLKAWAGNPKMKLEDVLKSAGTETVSEAELSKEIKAIFKSDPSLKGDERKAFRVVMGEMMKKYRGKADGKAIADLVRREAF